MTTTTARTDQGAAIASLLEQASKDSGKAMMAMSDIVLLCTDEADGESLELEEARALLGHAYIARRWAEWALDETDNAMKELVQQVFHAAEHVEPVADDAS
jgi:hypothetical protein